MTRRLPALPPEPPERRRQPDPDADAPEDRPIPSGFDPGHPEGPGRSDDDDRDDRDDRDDGVEPEDWLDDPAEDELIDPSAWPDDPEDDDALPAEDPLDRTELEHLPPLDGLGDDGIEDDVDLPTDDAPLEDDLDDLDAPDDAEVPVLAWSLTVGVDGRRVDAIVDPGRARTAWLRPGPTVSAEGPSVAVVELEIAGVSVRAEVECAPAEGAESVVLGRDVLAGRFLLRP